MRVSREISLGSSLRRASTDALILINYVTIMLMFSMGQGVTHASNLMVTCHPILHNVLS